MKKCFNSKYYSILTNTNVHTTPKSVKPYSNINLIVDDNI